MNLRGMLFRECLDSRAKEHLDSRAIEHRDWDPWVLESQTQWPLQLVFHVQFSLRDERGVEGKSWLCHCRRNLCPCQIFFPLEKPG
jgi:hypothetical protein